jgi:hypothetical protein
MMIKYIDRESKIENRNPNPTRRKKFEKKRAVPETP